MSARAFGYLRLSRDRDTSTSIEKQRAAVTRHCDERGWTVVDWFQDVDVSGTKDSRPALDAMLARLAEVDVIVFQRLDRVMRSVVGFAKLLERCRAARVELVSATEPFDTSTAIGRTLVWLLASVAEIEAENTSTRIRATHDHLATQGRFLGGRVPFGWRYDVDAKQLEHDEVAVHGIRAAAAAFLTGRSLLAIANGLEDGSLAGAPMPRPEGGRWSAMAVRRMLSSWRLLGFEIRHGRPSLEEPVLPPILDAGVFERLQAELARRSRARVRPREDGYELTGLLTCATCHARMYAGSVGPDGRFRAYRCPPGTGHYSSISRPWVEAEASTRLFAHVAELRLAERIETARDESVPDGDQELRSAIARLEWGREELLRDYYEEQRLERGEFERQLQDSSERLERLREKVAGRETGRTSARLKAAELADLERLWPLMETSERRMLFGIFAETMLVHPAAGRGKRPTAARLEVRWHPVD